MSKREAELKSGAMKELLRQCPSFVILQLLTAGAPDRLIIGAGRSTAWEFKHATPDFLAHDNQTLLAMRLDHAGLHTRYVVWQENSNGGAPRTMIVTPRAMHARVSYKVTPEAWTTGFDHGWLVQQIREAHGYDLSRR